MKKACSTESETKKPRKTRSDKGKTHKKRKPPVEVVTPELLPKNETFSVAGRNWSSMNVKRMAMLEGRTIRQTLEEVYRRHFFLKGDVDPTDAQLTAWLDRCRCRIDNEEIPQDQWDKVKPKAGAYVEFIVTPGKGGGGKNPLAVVLQVVVAVVAVVCSVFTAGASLALLGVEGATMGAMVAAASVGKLAMAMAASAIVTTAVTAIGNAIVNKVCPQTVASPQASISSSQAQNSTQYSISGARNQSNPYGYIPLVLGQYRTTPPLGAKSWTKQIGDDQYYNMLVVWGHPDMTVTDFRIGETPLSDFGIDDEGKAIVDHRFHASTYGNDLAFFNHSYDEKTPNVSLDFDHDSSAEVGQWHTMVIGECDEISLDIYFAALVNMTSGKEENTSVSLEIQYAKVNTNNWQYISDKAHFTAPEQYVDTYTGASKNDLWCDYGGKFHARQSDEDWGKSNWASGKIRVPVNEGTLAGTDKNGRVVGYWSAYPITRYKDKHKHHEWWTKEVRFEAAASPTITCTAATTTGKTFNYTWSVPNAEYKVRVRRVSRSEGDSAIQDNAVWKVVRAVTYKPAFNTPIPICVSELRIKASDMISGYVDNFNALCQSNIPCYNPSTKKWDKITKANVKTDIIGDKVTYVKNDRYTSKDATSAASKDGFNVGTTSNPADILHYLFTSRHALNNPYTSDKLDDDAFAEFWTWCNAQNLKFDYVCDSEASAWSRWVSVASAARGAVTADKDGLFSVTIDNANKVPVQMFTPRNSWGFTMNRSFYKMPHALRVSYYQKLYSNDDKVNGYIYYENRDGFIYADGYNKSNATDIQEWTFTGKTDWEDLYKMGRYYLAATKLRPLSITINTDWEWMMCHRGDVVSVAHDVLMNTFGTARVVALIYKETDGTYRYSTDNYKSGGTLPVGVKLDDSVIFSEESAFGIAIRSSSGKVLTYKVESPYMTETSDMIFKSGLNANTVPYVGALCSVAIFGSEVDEYIVASINISGSDGSAELELAPWKAKEILQSAHNDIPAWSPTIMLPVISSTNGKIPAPKIRDIRSDESVMIRTGDSVISCLAVWWSLPSGIPDTYKRIYCQLQVKDNHGTIKTASVDVTESNYVFVQGVEDNVKYKARIRLSSETGEVSDWTSWVSETVVGKSSLPSDVEGFSLSIDKDRGVIARWNEVGVYDLSHYKLNWNDSSDIVTIDTTAVIEPFSYTGKIDASVVAVDTGSRESAVPATASCTVYPPKEATIKSAVLKDDGIHVEWENNASSFTISQNTVFTSSKGAPIITVSNETTSNDIVSAFFACPASYTMQDSVKVQSRDIFNNYGEISAGRTISWYVPKTPKPVLGVNKLTGALTIDWEDCRNTLEGAPTIDHYEIIGTLSKQTESAKPLTVVGTHYESVVPLKMYVFDKQVQPDGMEINVGTLTIQVSAVDKYGITNRDYDKTYGIVCDGSKKYVDNTVQFEIMPPYNPSGISITRPSSDDPDINRDNILVSWKDCSRTFAIDHYIVYDKYTDTEYNISTNYVALPIRKEGRYPITITAYDVLGQSSATIEYPLIIAGVGGMTVFGSVDGEDILLEWSIPDSTFSVDYYIISKDNDIDEEFKMTNNFADLVDGLVDGSTMAPYEVSNSDIDIDSDGKLDVTLSDVSVVDGKVVLGKSYTPEYGNGDIVGKTKSNFYRIPGGLEGTYVYYVWAVDVAGNVSKEYASYTTVEIKGPNAPVGKDSKKEITAVLEGEYVVLDWAENRGENNLPIKAWDVIRQHEVVENGVVVRTDEIEYGRRLDIDQLRVFAFEHGEHTFYVRGIDSGGNVGPWGYVDFSVKRPGKASFTNNVIIDNNVQLYWTIANKEVFFPIAYYIILGIDEDGYASEITRVDSQFAGLTEVSTGTFTYALVPVDVAGNMPEWGVTNTLNLAKISVELVLPNDFVFYDAFESTFTGVRTNLDFIEGQSLMIGPVPTNETWQQNINRVRGSVAYNSLTWAKKVSLSGGDSWLLPLGSSITVAGSEYEHTAQYVEVVDHIRDAPVDSDTLIPNTSIQVMVSYTVLSGTPEIKCKIEYSADGETWTVATENGFNAYAGDFRKARYTLTIVGGVVAISAINYKLDVKKVSDYGRAHCKATDNGEGASSNYTGNLRTGTWVPFNTDFVDVQSLGQPNVVIDSEEKKDYRAYTVFLDTVKPEGFLIYVLDKNGNRVTADVDWIAYGV